MFGMHLHSSVHLWHYPTATRLEIRTPRGLDSGQSGHCGPSPTWTTVSAVTRENEVRKLLVFFRYKSAASMTVSSGALALSPSSLSAFNAPTLRCHIIPQPLRLPVVKAVGVEVLL